MVQRLLFLVSVCFAVSVASELNAQAVSELQSPAKTKLSSQQLLPPTTVAWFSVQDLELLKERFTTTQFGQMTKDPELKGFISSIESQFKNWLNGKNVRLGLNVEDVQKINSGEICLAGVLQPGPDGAPGPLGRDAHGLVLLVDVTDSEDAAKEMLTKVESELVAKGAKREKMGAINGVKVGKWTLPAKAAVKRKRTAFHTVVGGWLVASDNESTFRDAVRRLNDQTKLDKLASLSTNPAFKMVRKRSELPELEDQFSWFVDPFGYMRLARAIVAEEQTLRKHTNDISEILMDEGFDAVKGIGGRVNFATGEHEMIHRTFLYAPLDPAALKQKRFIGLFDFTNKTGKPLTPQKFVPEDVSSYVTLTWDMAKALKSVGPIIDSIGGDPGDFERTLEDLKKAGDADFKLMAQIFNGRVSMFSTIERVKEDGKMVISEKSEKVAIVFPIEPGKEAIVLDQVKKIDTNHQVLKVAGRQYLLFDSTEGEELPGIEGPDDIWGGDIGDDPDPKEEEFQFFEKKFVVVAHGHLVICNDKQMMIKILKTKNSKLVESADYQQVNDALNKLVSEDAICIRHFGRVDKTMEVNYEVLRNGKFGTSQTMVARGVNYLLNKNKAEEAVEGGPRVQKIDGSKLPANYKESVAPYFGPTGWVNERVEDGWRSTGVMLKKSKASEEVVRKPGNQGDEQRR